MKSNIHILVVEDEWLSAHFLEDILREEGYINTYISSNAQEALEISKKVNLDFVFMDINIEGPIDGIQCAKILNNNYFLPIIYITAYRDLDTIKEASETNIYGYLVKPFDKNDIIISLKVIENQLKIIKNKDKKQSYIMLLCKGYEYNLNNKTIFIENIKIDLTKRESNLLYLFVKDREQFISYEIMRKIVWNDKDITNSTIRDAISRLRKKMPNLNIVNNIGFGYRLEDI
ncbi:MAG: DNA-binding response OmpR family regulator [Sulfurimonas sp.]|jgi:DNA-binding response OmpR family regulator